MKTRLFRLGEALLVARLLVDLGLALPFVVVEPLLGVALELPWPIRRCLGSSWARVGEVTPTTSETGIMRHRIASSHRLLHTYHANRQWAMVNTRLSPTH